ncbi:hypothetical protein J8M21_19585 [Pseudoalteromonas luteoviolacea]|uniref:hypothetical protein n=1 Tax=Pseudoalteromonas luteoviolacea TaxID=43657 RepID=UPI001B3A406C|nr:hypothetical protein [Pseudoalteromonas luteoviolacea]MBQ4879421.1 hypothetical protein [Pseudoalteromonas luteoviolacea]MBQ4908481.1 hypothetical protein [Pseudoalteromonas luteoviolacea]
MNIETEHYKIIEDEEYGGVQIQLFDTFNNEIMDTIKKYKVTSILLSQWKGWKTQPLDFLADIKNLKVVAIFDSAVQDLSVIEKLQSLEVLYLECPKAKTKVDFKLLEKLVDARFDWRPCFSSICESNSIQTILINGYKGEDLSSFKSQSLSRLDIVKGSKLASLKGIENNPNLKSLMLYQCSKLVDISSLQSVALERIEFETCKKLENLESVFEVSSLKHISLDKCGQIRGLTGISKLGLDSLVISDTVIEDGRLDELLKLKCSKIYFDNKKHYSHTLEEVRSIVLA